MMTNLPTLEVKMQNSDVLYNLAINNLKDYVSSCIEQELGLVFVHFYQQDRQVIVREGGEICWEKTYFFENLQKKVKSSKKMENKSFTIEIMKGSSVPSIVISNEKNQTMKGSSMPSIDISNEKNQDMERKYDLTQNPEEKMSRRTRAIIQSYLPNVSELFRQDHDEPMDEDEEALWKRIRLNDEWRM